MTKNILVVIFAENKEDDSSPRGGDSLLQIAYEILPKTLSFNIVLDVRLFKT